MHKSFTAGLLKLAPGMTLAFRSGLFPFLNRLTAARKLFVDYGKGIAEKYDPSYYEEGQKTSLIHNLMQGKLLLQMFGKVNKLSYQLINFNRKKSLCVM